MKQNEWEAYSVGKPSTKSNWTNPDCRPLDTLYHICHVSDAYRMFEDRKIRSSLVWDESRLNNTRTCVAWLSPNYWSDGSLFGNIEFDFNWRELVEEKNFYWVETIQFRPPAFRILITDKEAIPGLQPYPVEAGNGPLFYDAAADAWYWNGNFRGEFMIDGDLDLLSCKRVSFVRHKKDICKKDGAGCLERGQGWDEAGTKLLSRLIAQRIVNPKSRLRRLFLDGEKFESLTERVCHRIVCTFSKLETTGTVTRKEPSALPLATALLDRLGTGRKLEALASLFKTPEDLELTVRKRVAKAFDIPLDNVPSSEDD